MDIVLEGNEEQAVSSVVIYQVGLVQQCLKEGMIGTHLRLRLGEGTLQEAPHRRCGHGEVGVLLSGAEGEADHAVDAAISAEYGSAGVAVFHVDRVLEVGEPIEDTLRGDGAGADRDLIEPKRMAGRIHGLGLHHGVGVADLQGRVHAVREAEHRQVGRSVGTVDRRGIGDLPPGGSVEGHGDRLL